MKGSLRAALIVLLLSAVTLRASDHTGKVTLTGVSIPGATVTAKQAEKSIATITDQTGSEVHRAGGWRVDDHGLDGRLRDDDTRGDASCVC